MAIYTLKANIPVHFPT